eukprot:1208611-Rhodomonas_salina.3
MQGTESERDGEPRAVTAERVDSLDTQDGGGCGAAETGRDGGGASARAGVAQDGGEEGHREQTERMRAAGQNTAPDLSVPNPGPDIGKRGEGAAPQRHFNHGGGGGQRRGKRMREDKANAILDRMQ